MKISRSVRAEVKFPVSRIGRYLRKGRYVKRVGWPAGVFLARTMEYVAVEVLELAGNAAIGPKKRTITPRHIVLGIMGDDEMWVILQGVTVPQAGFVPNKEKDDAVSSYK